MFESLKNRLPEMPGAENVRALVARPGVSRIAVPAVLAAAIVTAVVVLIFMQSASNFRPVFGGRENVSTADVVAVLEADGVKYRLHPDSGQVLVPEGDLGRARMLLAAKGVAAKLPEGLELMDRNDPLGVSQFVQDVRFRRGLEGELARSIATLDAVSSARVHLSIARSSSFVVNTGDKSTASVVLQMKSGQQLQPEQIAAIVHMVSSSVAGLDPTRVSLTDQAGNFLSARVDLSEGFDPMAQEGQAGKVSAELRQNAQELLAAIVGNGHFRVTVAADLSQEKTDESFEQYSGTPRILSEATREENDRAGGAALGVPGSLSNRPINVPTDADGKDGGKNFRAAVSRNYAYDRNVVKVQRGKGRINKLHVAIILDDAVAPKGADAWTDAELARVEKLLRVGLGVDSVRGDQIALSSTAFTKAPEPLQWWQDYGNWYQALVMLLWVAAGAVLLLLLWRLVHAVLRPLGEQAPSGIESLALSKKTSLPAPVTAAEGEKGNDTSDTESQAAISKAGAESLAVNKTSEEMSMVPLLENVDLPPPGSEVDVMVDHLRALAAKEPERVAEVVKQWVQKHGQPAKTER